MSEFVAGEDCIFFMDLINRWNSEEIPLRLVNGGELSAYVLLGTLGKTLEIEPLENWCMYRKGYKLFYDGANWLYQEVEPHADLWFSLEKRNVAQAAKICFKLNGILRIEREKPFLFDSKSIGSGEETEELKRRIQELEFLITEVKPRRVGTYLKIIKRFCDCQSLEELNMVKKEFSCAGNTHKPNKVFDVHNSALQTVWEEIKKLQS